MKIITVTDTWAPQVNGVARTIEATNRELERAGHTATVLSPDLFLTVPCPGYAQIRLAVLPHLGMARRLAGQLARDDETAIHIATEGPLGRAARRWCQHHAIPFSTGLSHAVPAVPARDVPRTGVVDLRGFAPISPRRDGRPGADADGRR